MKLDDILHPPEIGVTPVRKSEFRLTDAPVAWEFGFLRGPREVEIKFIS